MCACICVCVCVKVFFLIIGAVFISYLLKMLNRGIEVRGFIDKLTGSQ